MYSVGPLQLLLLVAIAGAGAMCGFVASVAVLRNKRRARGCFLLGVLTGWLAAAMTHGMHRQLGLFSALVGGFFRSFKITKMLRHHFNANVILWVPERPNVNCSRFKTY